MQFESLREAFLRMRTAKHEQIDREIDQHLRELGRREFVPYITRTRNTINDDDVTTLEKAHELGAWYRR